MTDPTQQLLESLFAQPGKQYAREVIGRQGARALGKYGAQVLGKTAAKATAKTVARTAASPWLLASDALELGTTTVCRSLSCDEPTARNAGKLAGLASSVAIGAGLGGPPGAVVGAAVWAVGELIGGALDSVF